MLHELDPMGGGREALRDDYVDRILREGAESLDLTPTQYAEAVASYTTVGEWLDAPDSPLRQYRPLVYPHGSTALGTPTKPLGRDDFDIDAVCLVIVSANVSPAELKRLIGDRLRAHYLYSKMLEEKGRCWRLNYARTFHLDITPAKPKFPNTDLTAIYITDKELRSWKESNPKAYIAWFAMRKAITRLALANRGSQANVEPAPEQEETHEKAPLQVVVQLLKRHRDVTFEGCDDAPISIIITTLAGHAYQQERSIIATMRNLVVRMPLFIDYSRGYAYVANPTIAAENFADKWRTHPEREHAFQEWIHKLGKDLNRLSSATGMSAVRSALIPFFGENRTDIVLKRLAQKTNTQRKTGLKTDTKTGLIGVSSGIVIPNANLYGDDRIRQK